MRKSGPVAPISPLVITWSSFSVPSCGHGEPCTQGRPALCEPGAASNGAGALLSGSRRLQRSNGTPVHHHLGVSGFADFAVVSHRSLVKIDPDLPMEEAALFGCAVLTGMGAVVNTARMPLGASAAVIDLGGVGLSPLIGAVAPGSLEIIAIDRADDKLAFALELGVTSAVNSMDPNAEEQIKASASGGVEFAFDLTGVPPHWLWRSKSPGVEDPRSPRDCRHPRQPCR